MLPLRPSILALTFSLLLVLWYGNAFANIVNSAGVIAAKHSGKCLNVSGSSTADGTLLVQNICDGGANQQWTLRPFADAYQIVASHSGKCLNVYGASLADGAQVIQWPCVGANNELWYANIRGDYFQLVAKHSGKCLNVFGGTQNVNERIIQWNCGNGDNELWSIGSRTHSAIGVRHSNQCMDVAGASVADTAAIIQYSCHGGDNQQWTLMPYQDAYRIIAKHSGKCLDVEQASQAEGARVLQYGCHGANNQLWYPTQVSGNLYRLSAKHSGKCLTVNANSSVAGEPVVQVACNNANNQLWSLTAASTRSGKWSAPINLSLVPVAAANLPDGKILLWSSHDRFSFGAGGQTYTSIFNPATNTATERLVFETGHDMFCPGTSNLADGRILVNGGVNSERTSIYNHGTGQWALAQNMNIARGYQANTVLSNGEVFTLGGSWSGGQGNKNGEVWNAASGWRRTPNILATSI